MRRLTTLHRWTWKRTTIHCHRLRTYRTFRWQSRRQMKRDCLAEVSISRARPIWFRLKSCCWIREESGGRGGFSSWSAGCQAAGRHTLRSWSRTRRWRWADRHRESWALTTTLLRRRMRSARVPWPARTLTWKAWCMSTRRKWRRNTCSTCWRRSRRQSAMVTLISLLWMRCTLRWAVSWRLRATPKRRGLWWVLRWKWGEIELVI